MLTPPVKSGICAYSHGRRDHGVFGDCMYLKEAYAPSGDRALSRDRSTGGLRVQACMIVPLGWHSSGSRIPRGQMGIMRKGGAICSTGDMNGAHKPTKCHT